VNTSPPRRTALKSFAQLYSEQTGTPPGEIESQLLRRCLYPHARLLQPILNVVAPGIFAADIDMIHSIAQLTDPYEFRYDAHDHHHPATGGFWRRCLFLRLSDHRLHQLVRHAFHPGK